MNELPFDDLPKGITLSQLAAHVGNAIRMRPEVQNVWVTAELSDVRGSGGHCYLELVEKNQAGATVAKMRAIIWSSTFRVLDRKFYDGTGGQHIATGIKALVKGSVTHHPQYGISFNISDIDPSYTMGDIERHRREILENLERMGILECQKSLVMDEPPQRIAVISAAGAAGYGDFCDQLSNNPDGFVFYPHLFPAVMQGEQTVPSVMAALTRIKETIDLWDCVVIIRGGGSTTDLISFDNQTLAEAVARFPIPVIVGIGHERDNTVLDYIANTRCKTPTAVAEFLTSTLRQSLDTVTRYVAEVIRFVNASLRGHQEELANETRMVSTLVSTRLAQENTRLQSLRDSIPQAVDTRLTMQSQRLANALRVISTICDGRIATERTRLDSYPPRIAAATDFILRSQQQRIAQIAEMVKVLSPEATLRRGYSITTIDGHAVTDPSQLTPGLTITTRLLGGEVKSTVNP